MKVLVVATNRERSSFPVAPLGALSVVAAAVSAGHDVDFLDMMFVRHPTGKLRSILKRTRYDAVGFSIRNLDNCLYAHPKSYFPDVEKIVRTVRSLTDAPLILGGAGFSVDPLGWLGRLDVQCGVAGEGEYAFVDLLSHLAAGTDPGRVRGVVRREDAAFHPRSRMDLVALDPPAHARCEYSQYLRRGGYVGIQTKRGCPCKCIYCVYPALEGDTFRLREPADIADEIQSVTAMNSARYFYITDSVFNMPRQFALAVCDEMIRRGLSAKWTAYCNPVGLDEEMAAGLAAAGCIGVELGLDSACDKMLETMGKPFGCDEIRTATSALKKAGLPFSVHLLFGGPGETLDDVRHTAEFIDRCPSANAVFATVGIRIYPGTGIESIARQESVIDADTDLFEPTYYLSARLGPDPQKSVDTVARSRHEWTTATDWRRPLMRIIQFLANRFQVRPQWQDVRNYGKYFRW